MESLEQNEYKMLSQQAGEKIKSFIAEKQLKAGDQLPTERNLAEELEVSRPVIREALGTLEALGIIVKQQGKGIFLKDQNFSALFIEMMRVWQHDEESLEQLMDFRILLEQAAVGQIIEHAREGDYEKMNSIIIQSDKETVTVNEFIKLDYMFHQELLSLTGNPMFIQLTDIINKYFLLVESNKSREGSSIEFSRTIQQHREIVALLKTRDKEGAIQMLKAHLNGKLLAR